MNKATLYEAIFRRKSVRKYDSTPPDEGQLAEITAAFNTLTPLYDHITIELKLISGQKVKGLFQVKAPYYIVLFSEPKEGYLSNGGFMLQQLDLYLSALGIGSCWQGMAKPDKETLSASRLEMVSVLAIGRPGEPLSRKAKEDFKRKSLEQISSAEGCETLLEACRLAPSAVNGQPWFFTGNADEIQVHCAKQNFIKALIYDRLNKIDIGIALCHLWLAADHAGKGMEFLPAQNPHPPLSGKAPDGYYQIGSVRFKAMGE